MEMKTCMNGHSYDGSFNECPQCNSGFGSTMPLVGVDMNAPMDGWGSTVPVWDSADNFNTAQQYEERNTVPINPVENSWADTDDFKTAGVSNDDYAPTMPLNYSRENTSVRPVTGWLVCVEGIDRGKDYRLHTDINYIGRSKSNDVVLGSDPTVSRDRHAMIAYDERGKMFFFAPANGSSLIRQNGRPVLSTVELKSGDRLEIGNGTYLFMALCGEDFVW